MTAILRDPVAARGIIEEWTSQGLAVGVDFGCGRGSFLSGHAASHPGWRFVGIERKRDRLEAAARKLRAKNCTNVILLQAVGWDCFLKAFAMGSISRLFLLFPDPWPKRRHSVRRFTNAGMLRAVDERLTSKGEFWLMTDDPEYLRWSARGISRLAHWKTKPWAPEMELPETDFQRRFRGSPVYRLRWIRSASS